MWFFHRKSKAKRAADAATTCTSTSDSAPSSPSKLTKITTQYATNGPGNNPHFLESPPSPAYLPSPTPRIVPRHSNAFTSNRATGLNKSQQLQFIEHLKSAIIETAELTATSALPSPVFFKVVVTRKETPLPAFSRGLGSGIVYVAKLVAVSWAEGKKIVVVVDESEGEECVAEAVEGLWEKGMVRAGDVLGGVA